MSALQTVLITVVCSLVTALAAVFTSLMTVLVWIWVIIPVVQLVSLPLGMLNNWILNNIGFWDWIPPHNCSLEGGSKDRPGYYEPSTGGWVPDPEKPTETFYHGDRCFPNINWDVAGPAIFQPVVDALEILLVILAESNGGAAGGGYDKGTVDTLKGICEYEKAQWGRDCSEFGVY